MTSQLRRSFKDKAKETFGFSLNRRSDGDIPVSSPELPTSAPPVLPSPQQPTAPPGAMSKNPADHLTASLRPTSMSVDSDSSETREKRKSRQMAQPKGTLPYEVTGRDTLASIAAQFDTTITELKKLNKLMTTMVFPGQVLYITDKEYIPSESSSPASPPPSSPLSPSLPVATDTVDKDNTEPVTNGTTSPQPSDGKTAFDLKLTRRPKAPGLAKRQVSDDEPSSPAHVPPSEDEVRKIDQDCAERFIKVNVKHITDGQGVVKGVLLVTPNAIMFDPNVSDPLVVERGTDEYGMIAPVDTIISAAIYHDIAAMNQRNRVRTESGQEPVEVYHDKTCALYHRRVSMTTVTEAEPGDAERVEAERDERRGVSIPRSESVCSCGAMELSRSLNIDKMAAPHSSDVPQEMDEILTVTTVTGSAATCDDKNTDSTLPKNNVLTQTVIDKLVDSGDLVSTGEMPELSGDKSCDDSDLPGASTVHRCSVDDPAVPVSAAVHSSERTRLSPQVSGGSSSPAAGANFGHRISPSSSPLKDADFPSLPRDSGGSPKPSSSPKDQGLLSRTLGSLSSLGSSFPGSPNLTNLATGLFNWNQDGGDTVAPVSAASLLQDPSLDLEPEVFSEVSVESGERDAPAATRRGSSGIKITDLDIQVENVLSLDDKPELFKDLDAIELVPRPATHYEDLPLYLCLRIGYPSNKKVSKTCPIESYMKHKQKPEYWFCVPRDKVDPLYAFFLQWSPDIYGSDSEMSEREQGFVLVDHQETEDSDINVIDNHFDRSRQITKDWEIVNIAEARRRLSFAEVENLPLPELSDPSCILDETHMRQLYLHLPARAEGYPWTLVYSSEKHGFSLKTLYRTMHRIDSPIMVVIKDTESHVFGAMLPCAIVISDHFYGTGESFLFTFYPDFKRFGWSGINSFFIKGNAESLSIGAGQGSFGLWLDGDLYHGTTQSCETYNNDLLTASEDFVVKGLEAWGFL